MSRVINDRYELVSVAQLTEHPDNPRRGDVSVIGESMDRNGFYGAVVAQQSTGRVLAGNHRLRVAIAQGLAEVPTIWVDCSDAEARRILLADNRTSDLGVYSDEALIELLNQVMVEQTDLMGTGWDEDDLAALVESLGQDDRDEAAREEARRIKGLKPDKRALPLDLIFCFSPRHVWSMIAWEAGWKIGARSAVSAAYTKIECWDWRFKLDFIDNEFKAYDHDHHLRVVDMHQPKYATVMDLMTRDQCERAGATWASFDQVMKWAEQLESYCENVIVIPKYDCLDDIPDKYMLGYSVPTAYGGTPLPAAKFLGRRVHLLGGAWDRILGYLALLGDSVVSLDTNWQCHVAEWGVYVLPDGSRRRIPREPTEGDPLSSTNNMLALAVSVSLGSMARAVRELVPDGDEYVPPAGDLKEGELDEDEVTDDRG